MIIVDIGACVGEYIDSCLHNPFGVEMIYAFEPFKPNYDFLVEKYKTNMCVDVSNKAIGASDGHARFYKKPKKDGSGCDFIGNAGSSLKENKNNVGKEYDEITVVKLSSFMEAAVSLDHVDIVKIDTEGSEYDIMNDALDNGLEHKIESFCFEDHCRKVPGLHKDRDAFIERVISMELSHRFFIQGKSGTYDIPFKEWIA